MEKGRCHLKNVGAIRMLLKKTSYPVWNLYRTREINISILTSGVDIRKKEGCIRVNVSTLN